MIEMPGIAPLNKDNMADIYSLSIHSLELSQAAKLSPVHQLHVPLLEPQLLFIEKKDGNKILEYGIMQLKSKICACISREKSCTHTQKINHFSFS